jgi:hypothetical protein
VLAPVGDRWSVTCGRSSPCVEGWVGVEWQHIVCDPNAHLIEGALTAYENTPEQGLVWLPRLRVTVSISDLLMRARTVRDSLKWYTTPSIEGSPTLLTMSDVDLEH